jgi:hypothetical protein
MRTIIVFNDNSAEAGNATGFALDIAKKVKVDILILNLVRQRMKIIFVIQRIPDRDA